MPDPSSIIATLAAIKNSIDVVKAVKAADYDLDKSILKEKIAILVDSLLEAKIQANETLDVIQEKDKRVNELENLLKFKANLVRKNGLYFATDDGEIVDEPYCPFCWESEKKAIHLEKRKGELFNCLNCKNFFGNIPESPEPAISELGYRF